MLQGFAALYEQPERLTAAVAHRRIFAPHAYPLVRRQQLVPIVHIEALAMAAWFPVCWRETADGPALCVLRSLAGNAEGGQPPGSPRSPQSLPIALRAYPVAITPELGEGGAIMIDTVPADQPTDAGAPIAMPDGKPSRGLTSRYRSAVVARHAAAATQAMTAALQEAGAFRPWSLRLPLGGGHVEIEGLLHAPAEALDLAENRRLFGRFGVELSVLLTAHRMSLFRIGALLAAARTAA